LRRLAALERQRIIDQLAEIELEIADLKDILENAPNVAFGASNATNATLGRLGLSPGTCAAPR
ncbi:hypothetical protein, partial [Amycolatopsis tolypomycina]|uniref:hypothetical protein n=1 Tax=Amycolatopsis tolypomycina TaxID=208445 RepID=UPI0033B4560D